METETVVVAPMAAQPRFDIPNILWFFGAFTSAAASEAVITSVHSSARGLWILLAAFAFIAVFAGVARTALRAGWWVPGGVLAAVTVTFIVPATVAFERLIGVWRGNSPINPFQEYEGPSVGLAATLVVCGLIAFALVRFHFILAIVAFATFVLVELFVPLFVSHPSLEQHATAVLVVGVGLIVAGLFLDLALARRAAFWWHLVGLLALTIGLAYHAFRHTSWGWILILVAGAVILLLGASLRRATWGVFGIAGFYAPIAHYLDNWLGNLGLAFALALLGLGIVALGAGARVYEDAVPVFRRRSAA